MESNTEVMQRIKKVINSQSIAVLGTSKNDEPYSCLVAYAVTDDVSHFIFATMRQRLKYRNLSVNPRVSLIIDDRSEKSSDFNETTSITVIGTARDIVGPERDKNAALLLRRHPSLTDFVISPECAVIRVDVDKIYVVSEFESVVTIGK
ncbi:MAG: pyridoxamine 5'-phosphate oxidase family protein [Candidatus Thorarchaeota archaeon]|nr:pyridoxamine 5'-phosphate oxidase family protein [Candidatus Thorarchaeota archaeon]